MRRSRKWFWTAYTAPKHPKDLSRKVVYCCYQEEVCPTTGRHHWQGFTILGSQATASQFKEAMDDNSLHLIIPDDNVQACIDYCSKEETSVPDTFVEYGSRPKGRGTRTDLQSFVDTSVKCNKVPTIFEAPGIYARYPRFVNDLSSSLLCPTFKKKEVWYLYGPSGVGKTRSVYDTFGYENVYSWDSDGIWWDGYKGQCVILIDDILPELINARRTFFLKLLDGYPLQVPVKGSHVSIQATHVIFTSNVPYPFQGDGPFNRRFTKIECMVAQDELSSSS